MLGSATPLWAFFIGPVSFWICGYWTRGLIDQFVLLCEEDDQ